MNLNLYRDMCAMLIKKKEYVYRTLDCKVSMNGPASSALRLLRNASALCTLHRGPDPYTALYFEYLLLLGILWF